MSGSEPLVVVTGGGSGLGAAVCDYLNAHGYGVVVADLNLDAAKRTVASMTGAGTKVAVRVDVTDADGVEEAFAGIEKEHGSIYGLVCAAGGTRYTPEHRPSVASTSLDEWRWTFGLNIDSVFICTRTYVRLRAANPLPAARIVLFASTSGQSGGRFTGTAYAASKAATIGYARSLALEVIGANITVNTVSPGPFDTPAFRASIDEKEFAAVIARSPLGRIGKPIECAEAVGYLLSPNAGYVTGSILDINGGVRMQ